MKKIVAAVTGVSLVALTFALCPAAKADSTPPAPTTVVEKVPDSFIIKFKDQDSRHNQSTIDQVEKQTGVDLTQTRKLGTGAALVKAAKPLSAPAESLLLAKIRQRNDVAYAEPNIWLKPFSAPNDPDYYKQWAYDHPIAGVNMWPAWEMSQGENQTIAVIDTGIIKHPELDDKVLPGYDMITSPETARDKDGRDSNPQDEGDWHEANECGPAAPSAWHGSHVAGIAAATANNGQGIAGAAYKARILPVRTLGKCGGTIADIIDGLTWASGGSVPDVPSNPNVATVINMSLGGKSSCTAAFQDAINAATNRNIPVVVAAGNDQANVVDFMPGNCQNVITVAAEDMHGNRAWYSNYGANIDITAPGGSGLRGVKTEDIWSTVDRGEQTPKGPTYGSMPGTSMATPLVSGVVAMIRSAKPNLTPAEIENLLKTTARPMPGNCRRNTVVDCGAGILDAGAVLAKIHSVDLNAGKNVLSNGGFEDGVTGWSLKPDSIIHDGEAKSGEKAIKFLGEGKEATQTLQRTIDVPATDGRAILQYWVKVISKETDKSNRDKLTVNVGEIEQIITNQDAGTQYVPVTLDLSPYQGKQVTLKMEAYENHEKPTTFFVDDFTLKLSPRNPH